MKQPSLLSHTHCQVAQGKHTNQNLSKSMSVQHTVVIRISLPQNKKRHGIQQGLKKHRGSVVFGSSELLDSPPIQNFNNEKSKVNYKNIWLG
jgi:hypothetical protein